MRYLLDTNILVHLVKDNKDEISNDVWEIINDFSNQIYTSSISVIELFQLHRIGKIRPNFKTKEEMIDYIEGQFYIEILPYTKKTTEILASLDIAKEHNDPFDHAIISQAMADKLTLISSDRKFENYAPQGLEFVFNKR